MHAQRPALSGPLHVVGHIVLVVVGWCIFGGFWWLVLLQTSHALSSIIWLFSGALVLLPVMTLLWVLHNRGIYAHKGPRRQVQVVETDYAQDWMGRSVRAQFDQLKHASVITIISSDAEKQFLAWDDPLQHLRLLAS